MINHRLRKQRFWASQKLNKFKNFKIPYKTGQNQLWYLFYVYSIPVPTMCEVFSVIGRIFGNVDFFIVTQKRNSKKCFEIHYRFRLEGLYETSEHFYYPKKCLRKKHHLCNRYGFRAMCSELKINNVYWIRWAAAGSNVVCTAGVGFYIINF